MNFSDLFEKRHSARRVESVEVPDGARPVGRVKPPTSSYHYSNPNSQQALICQTNTWKGYYWPDREDLYCVYSDRLHTGAPDRYRALVKFVGTGDQGWSSAMRHQGDKFLCEAARIAFGLSELPTEVRIVHHFNVATGYSCPTIEAIVNKTHEPAQTTQPG